MRILLLTDGIFPFEIGGMQKHAHYMAKYLLKNGVDLTVYHCVTSGAIPPDINEKLERSLEVTEQDKFSSRCFIFPKVSPGYPGHYIRESYLYSETLFRELIKEKPFDFIYAKGFTGWYSLGHKTGLPPIGVQLHGLEMFQSTHSLKMMFQRYLLKRAAEFNVLNADYVFTYGGKIKELLLEIGCHENKLVIQNGGIERSRIINEEDIRNKNKIRKFLFIGRNERRKGYPELKEVLESMVGLYDFEMTFVGEIPDKMKIKSEKVKYMGVVRSSDVYYEIIDQHDVLVVPSISEGLPTVLIESMARGIMPLASDVGAVNGIVNKETGLLVAGGDTQQLKTAMVKCLEMSEAELLLKKKAARNRISKDFDWANLSRELLKFIKSVTDR